MLRPRLLGQHGDPSEKSLTRLPCLEAGRWGLPAAEARPKSGETGCLDSRRCELSFGGTGHVRVADPDGDKCVASWIGEDQAGRVVAAIHVERRLPTDHFGSIRLPSSGELDSTYASGGYSTAPNPLGAETFCRVSGAAFDAEGRLVLAGTMIFGHRIFAARFLPSGAPDTRFSDDGSAIHTFDFHVHESALGVAVRPNGRVLLAGTAYNYDTEDLEYGVMQLKGYVGRLIFADGFETGSTDLWSATP